MQPSVAGPKRPQDRIELPELKDTFSRTVQKPISENGYNKSATRFGKRCPVTNGVDKTEVARSPAVENRHRKPSRLANNDVSAKNTSAWTETEMMNNRPTPDRVDEVPKTRFPSAGRTRPWRCLDCRDHILHQHLQPQCDACCRIAGEESRRNGLDRSPTVKTSLAPGSRVVTEYLQKTGLQPYLDQLGFNLVGYGCTTCIGNSGPLDPRIEEVVTKNDFIGASVLSGNRNFEARVHQSIKANFLMSPPLVVAFALAGRVDIDLTQGADWQGQRWQRSLSAGHLAEPGRNSRPDASALDPETYRRLYSEFRRSKIRCGTRFPATAGKVYAVGPESTYIQEPPFFDRLLGKTWHD